MPDLTDQTTWLHTPDYHRDQGLFEDLGMLAYHHKNPLKNWWGNFKMNRKAAQA
jgi:hypothetical protein